MDDYQLAKKASEDNWQKIMIRLTPEFDLKEEALFNSLEKSNKPPFEQLEELYGYMTELFAVVGQYAPCHKGCADCCRMTILVSPVEVQYIESKTGITPSPVLGSVVPVTTPCPFLQNDVCSIYQYRPYVCRKHLALFEEPKWCRPGPAHNFEFAFLSRTKLKMCYNYILVSNNNQTWEDIRQIFPTPNNQPG